MEQLIQVVTRQKKTLITESTTLAFYNISRPGIDTVVTDNLKHIKNFKGLFEQIQI